MKYKISFEPKAGATSALLVIIYINGWVGDDYKFVPIKPDIKEYILNMDIPHVSKTNSLDQDCFDVCVRYYFGNKHKDFKVSVSEVV